MWDVWKSATTASGEMFLIMVSTFWTHKLPAFSSDLGDFLLAVKLSFIDNNVPMKVRMVFRLFEMMRRFAIIFSGQIDTHRHKTT